MRSLTALLVALFLSGCVSIKNPPDLDQEMEALVAHDATAVIQGGSACDTEPHVGFAYCRFSDGAVGDESLYFIGPPAECIREDACVFVTVYNQAGQVAWGGSIPKGKTSVSVPWKTLLGGDSFQFGYRGAWSWTLEVFFTDAHGLNRRSLAKGDLLLRVFKKGYTPLNRVENDPNFAWEWDEEGRTFKMTTGLRVYIGRTKP